MKSSVVHFYRAGPHIALVGNPNCGKTALFNLLTGSRQKVANYAGVTVERKESQCTGTTGQILTIYDLPGIYSLNARTLDEKVTTRVLLGQVSGEKKPDLVVCVVDATQLRRHLRLVLAVKRLGQDCIVALNMTDLAQQQGLVIDEKKLALELGLPVVKTSGIDANGVKNLINLLSQPHSWRLRALSMTDGTMAAPLSKPMDNAAPVGSLASPAAYSPVAGGTSPSVWQLDHEYVTALLGRLGIEDHNPYRLSDRIDRWVLHPVMGPITLAIVLFLVFQAVFAWAHYPMALIESATNWLEQFITHWLAAGWLQSLITDGLIAGLGGVLVFLPQIVILFFFILVLEESGYLPRAAFLLDRLMSGIGLSGRSFIPLLSSFACAIPGIMAARTIANERDRLVTILIAPLMTCSARLPVYALLIGAFIPRRTVGGLFELQGMVLFGLYVAGILGAIAVAWFLKHFTSSGRQVRSLMLELPSYHMPTVRNIVMGLWQRIDIFLKRVGSIILGLTVILWFLSSFPVADGASHTPAIESSFAGMLGRGLAVFFEPIGFNWQISIALIPGMAAREVTVSALGTVYALSGGGDDTTRLLTPLIAQSWSLATALSLLAWFVFAPQCLATLAAVKRETNGWRFPLVMLIYLFALAYGASFITFQTAKALGWG